ncbi:MULTISPECIES: pyridoxamine 5'-phosphate oxidase [Legionella]|uniref:Pyridoxine/pyridoxamine 5'-phosphate oxidase n=1 Tax=Legionella septentrionalis TaxID=2498109 RepID=A0A3S0XHJ5_9GAMM|nr:MULTISPECIES: pyridoxamine 5'-phosphate oxidase [Legionella]MCP0913934.1 pyridoxamine 5'-phosphate oxidase [Legionella sp. 27cVA30]RUQ90402.1 pyridoxamine 5'-phosphate oxidase [Legionella septentrionalis]RUR00053.1 pyridoxamine 5'-phosphate oxidase [Legionella septentrionalis]RUR10749.1 pyridoxamine 5'-phosphate oxidase [Legionella septentrionalis]RUR16498.1 pyridoxamine 5'-phosphate oxidase [Legionella septentrionalis]
MNKWKTLAEIRRDYGTLSLSEEHLPESPVAQFEIWFAEVLQVEKSDPTAMVLSTVDEQGFPDSRVVLLKGLEDGAFIFYTNYQSSKAQQMNKTPYAALNFYWPEMARQVRVRGRVKQVSASESDAYFAKRPHINQLSAMASPQSQQIESRAELEQRLNELITKYQQEPVLRPAYWGGYKVIPDEIEFWQGRDNRMHDRIHYFQQHGRWHHRRLAP